MSLQVWLPLNGNLNNQGLSNVTVPNNGATVSNDGKIGQCYSFDGTDDYMAVPNLSMKNTMTFALWYNPSVASNGTIPGGYHHIFDARKSGVTNGQEVLLLQSPNVRAWGVNCSYVLPANTWSHICIINNNGAVSIYVNGDLKTTGTTTMTTEYETTLYIGTRFSVINMMAEKMNDIRIYDHCLSPKEVSEIAKGLVLHYKLDDPEILKSKYSTITWNQLVQNGNFSNGTTGWTNWGSYTTTSVTDNAITVTKSSTHGLGAMCYSNSIGTVDTTHKYYIAATIKTNTNNVNAYFGFTTSNGSLGGNVQCEATLSSFVRLSNIVLPKNSTDRFVIRSGVAASAVGCSCTCKDIMCIDLTQMFGAGNEPTVEEFEIMFPLPYYPYNAGTQMTLDYKTVYDCSGYNNNGTITGSLSANSNTPRYEYSTCFDGSSYITSNNINLLGTSPFTISCWVKLTNTQSYQPVFWLGDGTSDHGFTLHGPTSNRIEGGNGTNRINSSTFYSNVLNIWNHLVFTYDGDNIIEYVNGILYKTLSYTYGFENTLKRLYLGKFWASTTYTGCISDARLYTTALSEQDIKDLYNTSAYVDNGQNLHCFEFVEDDDSVAPEITKTGIVKTQDFIENAETELYEDKIEANQLIEQ